VEMLLFNCFVLDKCFLWDSRTFYWHSCDLYCKSVTFVCCLKFLFIKRCDFDWNCYKSRVLFCTVSKKSSVRSCMVWRAICVGKNDTLRFVAVQKFLKMCILMFNEPRLQWVCHNLTLEVWYNLISTWCPKIMY